MKIKQIVRRDGLYFSGDLICEHCGTVEENRLGYASNVYLKRTLPNLQCSKCGKTSRDAHHWEGCWKEPGHYECAMARIERLEDIAFERGAMEEPPCFCCGYNGKGYYDPEVHPCAERHHRLKWGDGEEEQEEDDA